MVSIVGKAFGTAKTDEVVLDSTSLALDNDSLFVSASGDSGVIGITAALAQMTGTAAGVATAFGDTTKVSRDGGVYQKSVDAPLNSGTVSATITVPDATELIIVGISGYHGTSGGFASATFTKGGVDTPMIKVPGGDTSTTYWQTAMFYLVDPDTGPHQTLKFNWSGSSVEPSQNFSATFWTDVDELDPVRDSAGAQGTTFPIETRDLVVEPNDLIVAFSGFFNPAEDGSGAITSWTNLEELAQIPNNAYAEGAWATGTVESSPLLRASSTKVGAESGTNANQAGVAAAVVKPKRKGNTLLDGISISISTAIGISQQSVDTVGTARGTSTVVGVTNPGVMTGTATGSSIVSGVSSSAIDIVGIASGTSTVVGVGASIADTAGTSTGTASVVAGIIGNTMLVTCIGRQATASVGEVSFVSSQSIIEVTGVEAVGQVGDVTLQLNSQFVVEGVEATGAVGQARIAGLVPEDVAPPERRAGVRAENNSASVGAEIRIMSVSAEQPYYALAA